MADSMNMLEISVGKMLNVIRESIEDELYDTPLLFLGKSGIGKTASVSNLAKELGIGFKEFRLILTNETELMGLPEISGTSDGTRISTYAQNDLLPIAERDGEVGILLLDEITSCTANVRTAAMQLMDSSRKAGTYKLPPKWLIVCLGNGEDDGGNFQGMEFAFLNRCVCYRVEASLYCTDSHRGLGWIQWAFGAGVNSSVISFLKNYEQYFHKFNTDDPAALFPSPRSWTSLSTKMNKREAKLGGASLSDDAILLYACGTVGHEAGRQFAIYYKLKSDLVPAIDVLTGKVDLKALSLKREAIQMVYTNIISFMIKELDKDLGGKFDISRLDPTTGQMRISDENIDYLDNFIKLVMNTSIREDSLFLWESVMIKYSGMIIGILDKIETYQVFKKSPLFKELSMINGIR